MPQGVAGFCYSYDILLTGIVATPDGGVSPSPLEGQQSSTISLENVSWCVEMWSGGPGCELRLNSTSPPSPPTSPSPRPPSPLPLHIRAHFLTTGIQRNCPGVRPDRFGKNLHDGIGVWNHRQVRRRAQRAHPKVGVRCSYFLFWLSKTRRKMYVPGSRGRRACTQQYLTTFTRNLSWRVMCYRMSPLGSRLGLFEKVPLRHVHELGR